MPPSWSRLCNLAHDLITLALPPFLAYECEDPTTLFHSYMLVGYSDIEYSHAGCLSDTHTLTVGTRIMDTYVYCH